MTPNAPSGPAGDSRAAMMPACIRLRRWWTSPLPGPERRALRARLDAALVGIDTSGPLHLTSVCDQLARQRGRSMVLVPLRLCAVTGAAMWWRGQATDYVLFSDGLAPLHQVQLALHGIGHVVLDHAGDTVVVDDAARRHMLRDLDSRTVRRALGPTAYTDREERDAECFATELLALLHDWSLRPRRPVRTPRSRGVLSRLATLKHQRCRQG